LRFVTVDSESPQQEGETWRVSCGFIAVTHHPASLSWAEAAAVWLQYLTAYGALIDLGKLTKGDTILIPAASSSVGLAAIQIAKRVGAVPVALTRGKSKRQALLDAGAAHVIATDEQDLVKEVLGITGGKGARVVFDPVGGPTFAKLAQATARLGILFLRCAQPGADATSPVRRPGQVGHDSRLRDDGDHDRPGASGTGEDVRE
jgi:NADPH:quinone reductase-like Zn-dependent oxidoreductase